MTKQPKHPKPPKPPTTRELVLQLAASVESLRAEVRAIPTANLTPIEDKLRRIEALTLQTKVEVTK